MKTYPMVAIAVLGIWIASSAGGESETEGRFTAPAPIQDGTLVRIGVDRHPLLATQYPGLTRQEPIQVILQFGADAKNSATTACPNGLPAGEERQVHLMPLIRSATSCAAPGVLAGIGR